MGGLINRRSVGRGTVIGDYLVSNKYVYVMENTKRKFEVRKPMNCDSTFEIFKTSLIKLTSDLVVTAIENVSYGLIFQLPFTFLTDLNANTFLGPALSVIISSF